MRKHVWNLLGSVSPSAGPVPNPMHTSAAIITAMQSHKVIVWSCKAVILWALLLRLRETHTSSVPEQPRDDRDTHRWESSNTNRGKIGIVLVVTSHHHLHFSLLHRGVHGRYGPDRNTQCGKKPHHMSQRKPMGTGKAPVWERLQESLVQSAIVNISHSLLAQIMWTIMKKWSKTTASDQVYYKTAPPLHPFTSSCYQKPQKMCGRSSPYIYGNGSGLTEFFQNNIQSKIQYK